jgi:hypothetical protein
VSYILKVKHPQLGQGKKLQILGLGVFENGKAYKIEEALVQKFETLRGDFVKHMHATHGVELTNEDGSPVPPPPEEPAQEEDSGTPPAPESSAQDTSNTEGDKIPEGGEQ